MTYKVNLLHSYCLNNLLRMKTDRVRAIIRFLRGLKKPERNYELNDVADKVKAMGATYIDGGCFSSVYEIDGFCLKLSIAERFENLRQHRHNPIFKRFAPVVYWIHEAGFAILCKLIKEIKYPDWCKIKYAQGRFYRMLKNHGFKPWDLHAANLVKDATENRWLIIDYGCWGI